MLHTQTSSGLASSKASNSPINTRTNLSFLDSVEVPKWCVPLVKMDIELSSILHRCEWSARVEQLVAIGSVFFDTRFAALTILSGLLIVGLDGWLWMLIVAGLVVLTTEGMKKLTFRLRPDPFLIGRRSIDFRARYKNFSFPSGDTAQSAMFGCCMFLLSSQKDLFMTLISYLWLTLIPWTAVSRVYFGCHWFGDTLIGASIGIFWSFTVYWTVPPYAIAGLREQVLGDILPFLTYPVVVKQDSEPSF